MLLVSGCQGAASADLSGTVADIGGHPLSGAAVVVGDGSIRRGVITGAGGTYHLGGLPVGRIPVHVFAPGMIYDPGHHLRALTAGANTDDVRLAAQRPDAGPRFRGDPIAATLGGLVHLQVQVDPGPGSPVGSELLAIDSTDGIAVLLARSAWGMTSAEIDRSKIGDGAEWRFIATDDACQESPTFPRAVVVGRTH